MAGSAVLFSASLSPSIDVISLVRENRFAASLAV
jgi:hypothetical protein